MIVFCPALLLFLCWMTRPVLSTADGLYQDDFATVLSLLREVLKLAKSAANGECTCPATSSDQVLRDGDWRRRILELIQELSEVAESEATSAARVDRQVEEQNAHKRIKRFHYTFRRRIVFPPGTKITLTPTVFLPFIRDLPDGLISNMSISFPFSSNISILRAFTNDLL